MRQARVLIDCRVVSRHLDGLGRYALSLVRAMLREPQGFDLRLIVPAAMPDDHPLRGLLAEAAPPTVTSDVGFMSLAAHVRVAAAIRAAKPDLYHYPHFNLPLGVTCRSVITIHDLTPISQPTYFRSGGPYKRWYFRAATAMSLRRSAAAIVPSAATGRDVERMFGLARRPVVIEEGVDGTVAATPSDAAIADFRARHGVTGPYLLYVGVDRPHKNLARVVDAFASIAQRIPHALVVVGQGHEGIAARATERQIGERVRRLGYLADADMRAAYSAADAFVLCSLTEGFGLPVLEAMRNGTPVVTSNVGATAEVAGDAALLVDPRSVEQIADALLAVATQPGLRADLRQRGLARAATFTWERAARRTLELYRSVLD